MTLTVEFDWSERRLSNLGFPVVVCVAIQGFFNHKNTSRRHESSRSENKEERNKTVLETPLPPNVRDPDTATGLFSLFPPSIKRYKSPTAGHRPLPTPVCVRNTVIIVVIKRSAELYECRLFYRFVLKIARSHGNSVKPSADKLFGIFRCFHH